MERRDPAPRRFERKPLVFYLILVGGLVAWWALVNPKIPMVPPVVYTSV